MLNVEKKFEILEKMKIDVNKKLDLLFLEKRNYLDYKDKYFVEFDRRNQLRNDLDKLMKEDFLNDKFFNPAEHMKKGNFFSKDQVGPKTKKVDSIKYNKSNNFIKNERNSSKSKEFKDKAVETESFSNDEKDKKLHQKFHLTFKNQIADVDSKICIDRNSSCSPNEKNSKVSKFYDKENFYLANELVNLRCKLNKINNKNKLLKNILHAKIEVKNCHILDKFINSFIEKLAINWKEISELIIDELIEQEIYHLNELELTKMNVYHTIPTEKTRVEKLEKNSSCVESLNEINKIIADCRYNEESITSKYYFK
jgi:hypothetical protein